MLPTAVRRKAEEAARLSKEIVDGRSTPNEATPPQAAADLGRIATETANLTTENARLASANRVLQGKYDAEVPRMADELRALKEKIKQFDEQEDRKSKESQALTDEERALLGDTTIAAMTKLVREVSTAEFESKLKPMTERLDQFQKLSEAGYTAMLDDFHGFDQQNDDPKFKEWLFQVDPKSGQLRNDLLQRAHGARQGGRVLEIFAAFRDKREIGASATTTKPVSPDPGAGNGEVLPDLNEQKGKIYTKQDIVQFYSEKRRGTWKGKEAEARALEQDMLLAGHEGRVKG